MATSPSLKNARVELRVTADQKRLVEEAAAIEGRSVTDFALTTLVVHAQGIIERERQLRIDAERFDAFAMIMDRPGQSIDGLRDLLTRQSAFVD